MTLRHGLLALMLGFGLLACDSDERGNTSAGLPTGSPSPQLALFDLNGKRRTLTEWQGKVLLVNFWATWCAPCRAEIPSFIEVRARNRDRPFEVIGIAVDRPDYVMEYASELAIPYPILLDPIHGGSSLIPWGNPQGALPYSVLLDRNGRVALTHFGKLSAQQLQAQLDALL